jgi:hypothetical protein
MRVEYCVYEVPPAVLAIMIAKRSLLNIKI